MANAVWLLLAIQILTVRGFLHQYPRIKLGERNEGHAGEPLFLTPYVESGNIDEGRKLARVPFTETLGIKSYSGFFTVEKKYDSNQFFWYFPAMVSNNKSAPVVIWLQGGPGATSMYGLFTENGPLRVRNGKFKQREYNWALSHHIIYIDNPVGAGFSFTNDSRGYCTDETQVGEQLYSTLIQFFQLFPELQQNTFFVTGESYGGKYVPALAYTIHHKNPTAQLKINLKGLAMGNGWSDPVHQMTYSKYFYQLGIMDWNQAKIVEQYENRVIELIHEKKWNEAYNVNDMIFQTFFSVSGYHYIYNYLHTKEYIADSDDFGPMLQNTDVRSGIHVGELPFNDGSKVYENLIQDIMQSTAPWISELLDHYYVVIYNGQLDAIVPYPLTVNFLRHLNFTGAEDYKTVERHIWEVDGEIAGYEKRAGKLVEVLVRNAGHMVPTDQPKWALDLITRFTHEFSNGDLE